MHHYMQISLGLCIKIDQLKNLQHDKALACSTKQPLCQNNTPPRLHSAECWLRHVNYLADLSISAAHLDIAPFAVPARGTLDTSPRCQAQHAKALYVSSHSIFFQAISHPPYQSPNQPNISDKTFY